MMSRQKFFTKALFICAICAAYFAVSFFLGESEAAGRKNRNRPKFPAPPATGFQSTIDNRQLTIENREPSTAFLPAAPADGECGISGFVMDYKERTEVAGAKLQARLTTGRQKLLTEYSEDDGFYCFSGLKNGKYTINTKKSGYQNNTKKLEYKGELLEADIYLKCKSSEGCADSSGGGSTGGTTGGGTNPHISGGTTGGTTDGSTGGSTSGGNTGGTTGGSTDRTAPTTTASPSGGTYTSIQSVTLSCTDNSGGFGCAKTYYTTNGSTPTMSSYVYSSAISISSSTTLKYYSVDNAGNQEAVKTESYTIAIARYIDNGNGTVTDTSTNLIWQQGENQRGYNWYQASGAYDAAYNSGVVSMCGSLRLAGYSDWRLPAIDELKTLIKAAGYPRIDTTFFPNADWTGKYWSSTEVAYDTSAAWAVTFGSGYDGGYYKSVGYNFYGRCVRGGQ